MSTPLHSFVSGTFTSDGLARNISLPSGYQEFSMVNITDIGSAGATTPVMRAYGTSAMASGSAYYNTKTNGAATVAIETTTLTGGFTFISDSGSAIPEAALAVTSATNAAPPVLTMTASTGNVVAGDIVRYYGASGQYNIAGMDFTAGAVVANTSIALAYMGAPGAVGAGGSVRRIPFDPRFYPRYRYITAITQAASAVVTLSVTHGYTVGQLVRVIIPASFGMTQINGLTGTVTAVNLSTNTITLNIDSSGFTAFAFPSSATAAAGVSFALIVPVGEAATVPYQNLLDDATINRSIRGVQVGTTVQTSGKLYQWFAKAGVLV